MLRIVGDWETSKDWLSNTTHLTHNELHLVLGVVLFLIFGRLLRYPLRAVVPLYPVAALELLNEMFDFLWSHFVSGGWTLQETLLDILRTVGPSLVFIALVRIRAAAELSKSPPSAV